MTSLTRRRALQTGAAAAAVAAAPRASPLRRPRPVVKLRILETTDLHVNVFPYDYYRDAADDTVGLARTAALVKAARARRPRTASCSTTATSSRARRSATSSPIARA